MRAVADKRSPAESPSHRRPWRPTLPELRVYNHLFSLVDTELRGVVSSRCVGELLEKTNLHTANIRLIIRLADTNSQQQITRREFYMALKMVSLAQSGRPIALESLNEPSPLPSFDGIDTRTVAEGKGYSQLLRYTPQPTIEVDRIISQAHDLDSHSIYHAPTGNQRGANILFSNSMTPPKSPSICSSSSDSLYDLSIKDDAADLNDSRSFMAATPQLRHFAPSRPVSTASSSNPRSSTSSLNSLSAKSASLPVPNLSINTNLSPYISSGNKSTSDIQSVDSVTELLARIDFMTSATACSNRTRSSSELQLEKSQQLRVELEKKMSQLHTMYSAEVDHNQQLSARICSEEEQISSLSAQISNAQKNIAYVAHQRIQLVDRLQKVEAHQREIRQQMENANIEAKKCSEDVTLLDNKMFGMERKMVRMQRHMRNQGSSVPAVQRVGSSESYGSRSSDAFSYSSGADTVYKRYETTKRNRLSTVFRKSAAA